MKFRTFNGDKKIDLLACPFCGADPSVKHIGNNYTKKRAIEIKCHACRIQRTDAALRYGFDWLEKVAAENWNQRVTHNQSLEPTTTPPQNTE